MTITKPIIIILGALFLVLQYKLWFAEGGITQVWSLKKMIAQQDAENKLMVERNASLMAEVQDLRTGQTALEESARNELGMTKPDEQFYQIVTK